LKIGPIASPVVIAILIAIIALASSVAMVAARNGGTWLLAGGVLDLTAVGHGQIWRLVTYAFFETEVWSLLFSCLMLYWFGGDLLGVWGSRRFVAIYLALAIASALVTCLAGRVWAAPSQVVYSGAAVVTDGLVVAWGLKFPARQMRLYGLVRLTGRLLVLVAVGLTILLGLFHGLAGVVPNLAAEALVWLWMGVVAPWRRKRRGQRIALAERGEAWSFSRWYQSEQRRRR
jgi:membrane associated rhomboid family serine protease